MSYKQLSRNTLLKSKVVVLGSVLNVAAFLLQPTSVFAQVVTNTGSGVVTNSRSVGTVQIIVNGTPQPTSQPIQTVVTVVVTATPTVTPTTPVYRVYKPRIALPTLTVTLTPTATPSATFTPIPHRKPQPQKQTFIGLLGMKINSFFTFLQHLLMIFDNQIR